MINLNYPNEKPACEIHFQVSIQLGIAELCKCPRTKRKQGQFETGFMTPANDTNMFKAFSSWIAKSISV